MAVTHTYYRSEKKLVTEEITPIRAIRAKCLDCSNWSVKEARECPVKTCPIWPYRMGRRQV